MLDYILAHQKAAAIQISIPVFHVCMLNQKEEGQDTYRKEISQSESSGNKKTITCCLSLYVDPKRGSTSQVGKLLTNQKAAAKQISLPVVHVSTLNQLEKDKSNAIISQSECSGEANNHTCCPRLYVEPIRRRTRHT